MRVRLLPSSLLSAAVCAVSMTASAAPSPVGVWLDDSGRGAVEIKPCGDKGKMCGHVVWAKDAADAKKGCGRQIIGDVAESGDVWGGGWIYSPERQRNYNVELKPLDETKLRVVGYAGTRFFSKTMTWTRAPANLERCATTAKAEPSAAPVAVKPAAVAVTEPARIPPPANAAVPLPVPVAKIAPGIEPKPAEAQNDQVTAGAVDEEATSETGGAETPSIAFENFDLGRVLKKSANGKCKLDLPWVKVSFDCER